jgi:hypothetical protein
MPGPKSVQILEDAYLPTYRRVGIDELERHAFGERARLQRRRPDERTRQVAAGGAGFCSGDGALAGSCSRRPKK